VWRHGIPSRQYDAVPGDALQCGEGGLQLVPRGPRTSLTFRTRMEGGCCCPYPEHCPGRAAPALQASQAAATQLEQRLVHQVYEEIAGHFSNTRHTPWPRVAAFVSSVPRHSLLLDLGCGNGKYLTEGAWQLGADASQGLLGIAAGRGHATLRCDLTAVPLRSSLAAGVICIAALHHLASRERRLAALREMSRLLAPSARLLVYVWARDQGQGKEQSTYLKQNKRNTTEDPEISETAETGEFGLPVHTPRTQFRQQDVLVPWSLQGTQQQYRRYYHVFEEGELEGLMTEVAGLAVVESYYDQGNWCAVAERTK